MLVTSTIFLLALAAAPQSAPPATPPAAARSEPIYDPLSDGRLQIEAGARVAASSAKRLLVNFGTNDCEACRVVNRAIHEKRYLNVFVDQFVIVFVDVTPGTKNEKLLGLYGIEPAKGYPAVVIFDETLKPKDVTKEGELAEVAKKGEAAVQEWLLARFPRTE